MSKIGPWRAKARAVILSAINEAESLGLSGRALEKHVSNAYPFGERANHPYQIWLSEVRLLVKCERPKTIGLHARPADLPGQGVMFDDKGEAPTR